MAQSELTVALAGYGAIGAAVGQRLNEGIEGLKLSAVAVRDRERAARLTASFDPQPRLVTLSELAEHADIVVECAPSAVFMEVAEPTLRAGRIFVPASVGAILDHPELIDLAREHGAKIRVPTGALLGLDAVRAAAEGEIESVTIVTRKPPAGLAGAPHIEANAIDLQSVVEPQRVFAGPVSEGIKGFPANVNVAVALSLAGIGADRTRLEIYADPTIERNQHHIKVEADAVRFSMQIEGVPSPENPATGKLTPLSVIATLRSLVEPMTVGT